MPNFKDTAYFFSLSANKEKFIAGIPCDTKTYGTDRPSVDRTKV